MDKMIKAQELIFEYDIFDEEGKNAGTKRALEQLNITVNSGEFVAILWKNGSGKSTFAKLLNGILSPQEGILLISGLDASLEANLWEIRQQAGMVFQNPENQIIATIVEEDVAFGPENLGIDPKEIRIRVDNALKSVDMYEYKTHAPHMLSGGQKQRIAIAGILAMHPKCIIFDEPTAMLDPSGRKEVMDIIQKLHDEGITVILITHYMEEAAKSDYVYVMSEGAVVLEGTPRQVFSHVEEMKASGLDVPQVTEIAYELRKLGYDIQSDILYIEELVNAVCLLKSKS